MSAASAEERCTMRVVALFRGAPWLGKRRPGHPSGGRASSKVSPAVHEAV